jgi:ABC-2 type transport system permease protein
MMRGRVALAVAGCAPVIALMLSGCGSTGITAAPLERSISTTFANLYVLQQAEQGNPRPSPRSLHSHTGCQKGTPATPQSGSGNWLCYITYYPSGPAYPVIARYKVDVQTDGCYAADGDGPASVNGSPSLTGPGYQQVVNPVALIDGCFDIT